MHWQRLDRENTLKTIDSVKSAADAGLFSPTTSEVQKARLSFYDGVELYKLTNFASLPSFTFEYLGQNGLFQYLDGTEMPIYTVNDKGVLILDDRTVLDYLQFFFAHVALEEDEVYFVNDARDMPLLDSLDEDSIQAITRNHKPPKVVYDAGYDRYSVEADLYAEGLLMRATVDVTASGRVSVQDRRMILNAVADSHGSGIMGWE
ncbi:MAG: hypothetical protein DI626_10795 [Micavibrio aeruginosavorus]|uniref:Uncharacterized protein n=1 Tax=Micavibrio aeruginosavorus TaxID=349221 RepID=A0A2W4ZIK5_9BACT|nr:MAG: hypothetical protein DI626_10795 [Micavibrio aeruginosavorus]